MDNILLCIFGGMMLVAAARYRLNIIRRQHSERDFVRNIMMAGKKKD